MPELLLPRLDERLVVIGRTGSGKTQGAAWILSRAPFDEQPYIIVNFKSDHLLNSIPHLKHIDFNERPKYPGVYMITPTPLHDEEHVEKFLREVWTWQDTGIFMDECYEIPKNSRAFGSLLRQGRSRSIPMIICTQRPVAVDRAVFTEASKYMLFDVVDGRDLKIVAEFIPPGIIPNRIPQFCSVWYDVASREAIRLNPVPSAETILQTFEDRLRPRHKFL